ncbi:MAG: hypothetical protein K0U08_03345 [Proteobacteria bacterium]|nr:hypothetical protein [Pseudomonadota bacterium]
MATLTTGKIAEVMFGDFVETWNKQSVMIDLVDSDFMDPAKLQNSGNTIFYPVEQHRPILTGFDLTGKEQGIIEETVPISLGEPSNDFIELRVDDMRDTRFWERAGKNAAKTQLTDINKQLINLVQNTGANFYKWDLTTQGNNGFKFASEAQVILDDWQVYDDLGRNYLLNTTDLQAFAGELSGRETLGSKADRSDKAYADGGVGEYVAAFDIYKSSSLSKISGSNITATTVSSDVSLAPEAGAVNSVTNTVTNIDYRSGVIPVTSSAAYAVGDWVSFTNGSDDVEKIGLADKSESGATFTAKVVSIPNGTSIEIFPKPIAADDPGLTDLEKAYANINTQILSGATVNKLNDATVDGSRANIFWTKDSLKMISGEAPWELMGQYDGNKVLKENLGNGLTAYMIYDGNIATATFRYRLFIWYGLSNFNPMANGVGVTYSS